MTFYLLILSMQVNLFATVRNTDFIYVISCHKGTTPSPSKWLKEGEVSGSAGKAGEHASIQSSSRRFLVKSDMLNS